MFFLLKIAAMAISPIATTAAAAAIQYVFDCGLELLFSVGVEFEGVGCWVAGGEGEGVGVWVGGVVGVGVGEGEAVGIGDELALGEAEGEGALTVP